MTATGTRADSTLSPRQPCVILMAGAVSWSALLLALAFVLPVESDDHGEPIEGHPGWLNYPKRPLVQVNGLSVLWIVAIPLITCLTVGGLLVLHRQLGWTPLWLVAITLSGLLTLTGIVGTVTILVGVLVIPSGALLLCACLASRRSLREPGGAPPGARWYPDPAQPSHWRWWDGQTWTDHSA